MMQKRLGQSAIILCLMCAFACLLTSCGSSSYAHLDLTLKVSNALGDHTYVKTQDGTAAQLYYHILQARKLDPGTYLSCPPPKETLQYHFTQNGKTVLDAHTGACYILLLGDNSTRLPDAELWSLTSQFTGQDVAPN